MPERITNKDGYVALQHYNSNGCTQIVVQGGERTVYTFVPQHNVSLAWVKPGHVDALLVERARMCCGKKQNKFFLASQINVNLWSTGNRHGEVENG